MSEVSARLYLATPALSESRDFAPLLASALSAGDVASLLIRFSVDDPRSREAIVRSLAPIAQARGVAVMVDGDVSVALRAGADGAHVHGADDDLFAAVKKLSPRYIVGAGDLATRDEAMRAGEAGVDYVLLAPHEPALLLDRVGWWSELFNTPSVARADTLADIVPLARAGADFIMIDHAIWDDPRGPDVAVVEALRALEGAQT
jgi:thiamine-phosphate pyrophosphorylase